MSLSLASPRLAWSLTVGSCIAALIIGVLLGRFAPGGGGDAASAAERAVDVNLQDFVLTEVNSDRMTEFLRDLSAHPHPGGTPSDEQRLAEYVAETWRQQGLDKVDVLPYDVLLSSPDEAQPNAVRILDQSGTAVFESRARQPPLHSPEERSPEVSSNFNAYSATGRVKGEVVYANYAREEDFRLLEERNVTVKGRIVIARYGKIFRGNKAAFCEQNGCLGLILYNDPMESAPAGLDATYPHTVDLPEGGVQLGTVYRGTGDPLTPFYPSLPNAFRLNETDAALPRIPVQPISAGDAYHVLALFPPTPEPPAGWRGALNVSYSLGVAPSSPGWRVQLDVHTHTHRANTSNVIGVLRGAQEPDRYVLVGNHRDAWIFGAVDPSSGTAALLEMSRVLTQLAQRHGWRPRRSIVFCSWGAEEYGLVGSVEWVEHRRQQLADRAVAYLNVDLTVGGNKSLKAGGVPLLYDVLYESAQTVPNPDPAEVAAGRPTVYDTWLHHSPEGDQPKVGLLGDGSDHKAFIHNQGVPSVDMSYTGERFYPTYHTLYETFYMMTQLQDPGLRFSRAICRLWILLTLRLSEDRILAFNVQKYAQFLEKSLAQIEQDFGAQLRQNGVSLAYVQEAMGEFREAARYFHQDFLPSVNKDDPLAVRQANDLLMMVERSFLEPLGLPDRPDVNHVIFSPSILDGYSGVTFPGLVDLLHQLDNLPSDRHAAQWQKIKQHVSVLSYLLGSAAHGLYIDL